MPSIPVIEPLDASKLPEVLALNGENSAATSLLDMPGLEALVGQARYTRGLGAPIQAFLIAMDQDAAYASVNFLWFKERYQRFLYIDRIMTAQQSRGLGLGRALYEDLFAFAQERGDQRVVCEVNLDPPNPGSDAFHKALGFEEVGSAVIHNGAKTVRYLEKTL